jgi:hypothetical protein
MSEFNSSMLHPVLGFLGISAQLRYLLWRRQSGKENIEFNGIREVPEGVKWLDASAFRVVAALCGM